MLNSFIVVLVIVELVMKLRFQCFLWLGPDVSRGNKCQASPSHLLKDSLYACIGLHGRNPYEQ
jgi:hypothetical protein